MENQFKLNFRVYKTFNSPTVSGVEDGIVDDDSICDKTVFITQV